MRARYGAITLGPCNGHFEFAWQELELRVISGPLTDQFGHSAWIGNFISGSTREMIRSDIADGVARCLDRVHFYGPKFVEHIGNIAQLRPIVLDVLARGEMAISLVILVREMREHIHLSAVERAIRNGHTQHVSVKLQINAVH